MTRCTATSGTGVVCRVTHRHEGSDGDDLTDDESTYTVHAERHSVLDTRRGMRIRRFLRATFVATLVALSIGAADEAQKPNDGARDRPALTMQAFLRMVGLAEAEFVPAWDALRAIDEEHLHRRTPHVTKIDLARIAYPWARGRIQYPYFHWHTTGADAAAGDAFDPAIAGLELEAPDLLDLDEYRSFLDAFVHERARSALRKEASLRTGDNRWTRAKYDIVMSTFHDRRVRDFLLHSIVSKHVSENGTRNLEEIVQRFEGDCGDETMVGDVREAIRKERQYWSGFDIDPYTTVDGVALELHIKRPAMATGATPALVWFHGGSWNEGAWYWCPAMCEAAVAHGLTAVLVEYRTNNRFNATPLESLADARSAIRYVRRNAERLGIDPARVVAAGFSSGGSLALMSAAVRGHEDAATDTSTSAVPDAVVVIGACPDPTEDAWFRQIVRPRVDPRDVSPAHSVHSALPPVLALHGTADEFCAFADVEAFHGAMTAAGNEMVIEAFPARRHFFLFQSADDRGQAMASLVSWRRAASRSSTTANLAATGRSLHPSRCFVRSPPGSDIDRWTVHILSERPGSPADPLVGEALACGLDIPSGTVLVICQDPLLAQWPDTWTLIRGDQRYKARTRVHVVAFTLRGHAVRYAGAVPTQTDVYTGGSHSTRRGHWKLGFDGAVWRSIRRTTSGIASITTVSMV